MGRIGQDTATFGGAPGFGGDAAMNESQLTDYLTRKYQANPSMPIPTGFKVSGGRIVTDKTFFQRHSWVIPLLFGAGGFAAGVATGAIDLGAVAAAGPSAAGTLSSTATGTTAGATGTGAVGAGGALGATSTVPATGALAPGLASGASAAGAGTAAGVGDTIAGTSAGDIVGGLASSGPKLGSLGWANLISGAAQAGGAYLQSRATGHAADLEAQAQKDALDFLKQRDARDYADQAPYRSLGAGAANSLGHYLGFPSGQPAPVNSGTSLGASLSGGAPQPQGGQLVTMLDSRGAEKQVPASEVQRLLAMGATMKPQTGAV